MPLKLHDAGAVTEQEEYAYEPESVPSEQVRVSATQELPNGTEVDWYAVTLEPCAMLVPLNGQYWYTVSEAAQVLLPPAPETEPE